MMFHAAPCISTFMINSNLYLAELLKIDVEKAVWCELFVNLVYTDFTHLSVHVNQTFVIQGCPTLSRPRPFKLHPHTQHFHATCR